MCAARGGALMCDELHFHNTEAQGIFRGRQGGGETGDTLRPKVKAVDGCIVVIVRTHTFQYAF